MALKEIARGSRIRVLVVDDCVVVRRLIIRALEQDHRFDVVGGAANGAIALAKIEALKPNLVTIDVEMRAIDPIEIISKINNRFPETVVVMLSTLAKRSAAAASEPIDKAARDALSKAAKVISLREPMGRLPQELMPKLVELFKFHDDGMPSGSSPQPPRLKKKAGFVTRKKFEALAVGVSTGGPTALAVIMPMIPSSFPVPIFVVQHMPATFTRSLAERLQKISSIAVHEAAEGMPVLRGHAYLAPGDFHMCIERKNGQEVIALNQDQPENSCRPAVDVLFRSVSEAYGGNAIAVVLTGMGQDGKRGAQAIRARGGLVIAQDKESSTVWGMPGAVVQAGLADAVVDLKDIVPEVIKNLH